MKKVTITVTATQEDAGYAVVRDIEFLKDIVPESPKNDQVQNLAATPERARRGRRPAPARRISHQRARPSSRR